MTHKDKKELREAILIDLLSEGFILVSTVTSKEVSVSNGYSDKQWEVCESNELQSKGFKTLERALKSASK